MICFINYIYNPKYLYYNKAEKGLKRKINNYIDKN